MKTLSLFAHNPLLREAKKLAAAGFSVIPVHGDNAPGEPKKPAIKWRAYQRRVPSAAEIDAGFEKKHTAVGVVCGQVSRLLVIDFDDRRRYRRFCLHLPQYAATYTVKTRRGCHLYFRADELVPSHQFDGGDIKGERSYVIAPPSRIADFEYSAMNGLPMLELEREDIDRLLNHFHVSAAVHVSPGRVIRDRHDIDFARLYERLAGQIGRNNALYRAASVAREQGMSASVCEARLLRQHVSQKGRADHRRESPAERLLEGQRTIASAYRGATAWHEEREGIPNSVRERLLTAQKSSLMPRLLDAFRLAGWQPGAMFTMKEAVVVARRVGISRKAALSCLTGELSIFNGRHIVSRRYAEYLDSGGLIARGRGRPVQLAFQVPSPGRLLAALNVSWTPSDVITAADLRTAKSYRQALHRGYIRRLEPQQSMAQLAGRIGLSARSIRRYNHDLRVRVTERMGRMKLTREALRCLPRRTGDVVRNATAGYWLETESGKRMPAWRHIGAGLLKAGGERVWICLRRTSRYSLPDDEAAPSDDQVAVEAMLASPAVEQRASVEYATMTSSEFLQARAHRGEAIEAPGLRERALDMLRRAKARVAEARYETLPLFFDTVAERIADDKIAETISGYLYAEDGHGGHVRRPMRRGIAWRMLKEFGEGKVFLALRDAADETLAAIKRAAVGVALQV